jgi:chromosome segregation ATPase
MDHVQLLALITATLTAAGVFLVRVFGEPKERMRHIQKIEEIEAKSAAARERAHQNLISSWERRAETLEARQALLDAANQSLRNRIDELERQVARAGNIHVADLATIANLREELDRYMARCEAHELDLDKRNRQIADLEARVAELEAILGECAMSHDCPVKAAKPARKKGAK